MLLLRKISLNVFGGAESTEAAKEAETAASELRLGMRAPAFYGEKAPTWMVAASDAVDEEDVASKEIELAPVGDAAAV